MITLDKLKALPMPVIGQPLENYWHAYEAIPALINEVEYLRETLDSIKRRADSASMSTGYSSCQVVADWAEITLGQSLKRLP